MVDEIVNKLIEEGEKAFDRPTLQNITRYKRNCKMLWKLAEMKGIRHLVEQRLTELYQQKQEVINASYRTEN
jgi:uncharacterized protein YaaR (DUF327 family)